MLELRVPPIVSVSPNAVEMIRVWTADKGLHTSVKVGFYEGTDIQEETAWGTILADVARHIASALNEMREDQTEETLLRIKQKFIDEVNKPSSNAHGSFVSE